MISAFLFIIGGLLILTPLIGLLLDLKKSKKYTVFLVFSGVLTLGLAVTQFFPSIEALTIYAFSLIPLLFVYVFLANKINKDETTSAVSDDEIVDN